MSPRTSRFRPALLAGLIAFTSLLSCGREVTGPGGRGRQAEIQFNPVFPQVRLAGNGEVLSISDVVDFAKVRIVLLRTNGDTAVDRIVNFPPDSTSIRLVISVTLSQAATAEGEPFQATLKYISAAGDTVFSGGPVSVTAKPAGTTPPPPPQIPVTYTGAGANAATIFMTPTNVTGVTGQTLQFAAQVYDDADNILASTPVAFTSTDSNVVRVNLRTGAAQILAVRGSALVIAQTLTGQADTATVNVPPVPTAIVLVSGGSQSVRQAAVFPQPVVVRVNAADDLPVAGVPVAFSVTRGQGAALPLADTTDANGLAQTTWTAGDSAGVGNLRATIFGTATSVTVPGNQLSSAPTTLTFETQPVAIVAGVALPDIRVVVRDATGDTVRTFNGQVTLGLTGGVVGANLVGQLPVGAVNGIITFTGLTVDRAATGFRLVASIAVGPTAQSNAFNVTPSLPSAVVLVSGGGQTAPPSTVLPDSVVVRVVDTFGFSKSGVTVTWAVAQGGGTVSPASAVTDANGRAGARWTLGAGGAQGLTATVAGVQPLAVGATVFQPQGQPTLFSGIQTVGLTILGSKVIPLYLEPAAGAPIVATLDMRDTSIAAWSAPSVTFTPGSTLRTPSIAGKAVGQTWAIATSSAGVDSIQVSVEQAAVVLSGNYSSNVLAGDTLWKFIRLTAPAPAGGTVVRVVSTDPSAVLVAPASGRGDPADECDNFYCNDLRADTATGAKILAPPSDTAFVTIPAGQTHGQVVFVTVGAGESTIELSAPSFAGDSRNYFVVAPTFYVYSYPYGGAPLGVGYDLQLEVDLPASMSRAVPLRITSRDPAVLTVRDSAVILPRQQTYAYDIRMVGTSPGTTYAVVESDGFAPESVLVQVVSPVMYFYDRAPIAAAQSRRIVTVSAAASAAGDWSGYWSPRNSIHIAATSSDTAVLKVDFGGSIEPGASYAEVQLHSGQPGTAWLRASAAGHVTDSVLVTVSAGLFDVTDLNFLVGVGQIHETMGVSPINGSGDNRGEPIAIDVTSSDPTIATVLTPTLRAPAGDYFPAPRFLGRTPGTVTITFSGPAIDTVTRTLTVVAPRIRWSGIGLSGGNYNADSTATNLIAYSTDTDGQLRSLASPLVGTVRSTDPSVVLVTDSVLHFSAGSYSSQGGQLRFLAPGSARLVLTAPGFAPETSAVITLAPYRIDIAPSFVYLGRGLISGVPYSRRSLRGAPLPVTVTASGPAGVTVLEPTDTIPTGASSAFLELHAHAGTGIDTVIVSAPGHAPDTLRVVVTGSIASPAAQSYGEVGQELSVAVALRSSTDYLQRAPTDSVSLRLSVSDSSVLEMLIDTMRVAAGQYAPIQDAAIRLARPGAAWLRLTDPSGRFASDSLYINVERPTLYASPDRLDIGMNQVTYPGEMYLYRPYAVNDSVWVHFTSAAPSVARTVTDSVLISPNSSYTYFDVTAGDSVGGTIITARAAGFVDLDIAVGVSRSMLEIYANTASLRTGRSVPIDVYLTSSQSYQTRYTNEAIPLRLRSADPAIAAVGADSLVDLPAGQGWLNGVIGPITGGRPGHTNLFVEDRRTGNFRHASTGSTDVDNQVARLTAGLGSYTLGLDLFTDQGYVSTNTYDVDGIWVQLRSVGGRILFDNDSVFISAYAGAASFNMRGLAVGTDTVVMSAPGFEPDTVFATIGDGIMEIARPPATLVAGDSVLVTADFKTSNGSYATVTGGPRSFLFTATGPLQATETGGTGPLTELLVPDGSGTLTFWVKATGAGTGELAITSPGFKPARFRVVMTPIP